MQKPPAKPARTCRQGRSSRRCASQEQEVADCRIVVLLILIAGGAGWFFSKGSRPGGAHEEAAKKAEPAREAKFVPLGENFTVNLQREEGDQYLQAGITLKILQPELEEKIKAMMPEIRSKLLFLLSSKKPSDLQTTEGKNKLISEIIVTVDGVLGITPPSTGNTAPAAGSRSGCRICSGSGAARRTHNHRRGGCVVHLVHYPMTTN